MFRNAAQSLCPHVCLCLHLPIAAEEFRYKPGGLHLWWDSGRGVFKVKGDSKELVLALGKRCLDCGFQLSETGTREKVCTRAWDRHYT